jgi:tyrosyl-tRNA synthetase
LPVQKITDIVEEHVKTPEKRMAQRTLAEEVVGLVHGSEVAQKCIYQTAAVYPAARGDFGSETILQAFRGDEIMLKQFSLNSIVDVPISQFLKMIGLVKSHSSIPQISIKC